ncbi:histidine phosphatase family protein [Actinopolymorpha pittospori]|uniref:Broad specificity phosphatase PhoE n=1 Tax=Actinopolymorpha pittospori TaxID=648752 RepID=A0A927RPL6_9ACTN|nr:histidine phosphatase family protein [Actinopolymorpha pittospori]MBE1611283.1 broad specificity phosphatase PhoE [Actinopolymorpha pittospori]
MATTMHLVRHGRVVPEPARPAAEWTLHPDAGPELAALRESGLLPARARWFSSPEPKAFGTARALTGTAIGFVDGLREMTRPAQPWLGADAWSALVRRSVDEPDVPAAPGWESAAATSQRVVGAVRRILDSCPDDDVVLVGHGTAWTLVVAALTAQPPDLDAWERLRTPDHCALEVTEETSRVVSRWGGQA